METKDARERHSTYLDAIQAVVHWTELEGLTPKAVHVQPGYWYGFNDPGWIPSVDVTFERKALTDFQLRRIKRQFGKVEHGMYKLETRGEAPYIRLAGSGVLVGGFAGRPVRVRLEIDEPFTCEKTGEVPDTSPERRKPREELVWYELAKALAIFWQPTKAVYDCRPAA